MLFLFLRKLKALSKFQIFTDLRYRNHVLFYRDYYSVQDYKIYNPAVLIYFYFILSKVDECSDYSIFKNSIEFFREYLQKLMETENLKTEAIHGTLW